MVNHPNRKLTPALRAMLQRIADQTSSGKPMMTLLITASGGREGSKLQSLVSAGWAEWADCDLPRGPVDGVRITPAGRAALTKLST